MAVVPQRIPIEYVRVMVRGQVSGLLIVLASMKEAVSIRHPPDTVPPAAMNSARVSKAGGTSVMHSTTIGGGQIIVEGSMISTSNVSVHPLVSVITKV